MTTFCWLPPERRSTALAGGRRLDAEPVDLALGASARSRRRSHGLREGNVPTVTWDNVVRDAALEHQAVAAPLGGDQADAAPRGDGGRGRQAAAVGVPHVSRRVPARTEQDTEQRRHTGAFEAGEADDLARGGRERDIAQLVPDRQSAGLEGTSPARARARTPAGGKSWSWRAPTIASTTSRDGR